MESASAKELSVKKILVSRIFEQVLVDPIRLQRHISESQRVYWVYWVDWNWTWNNPESDIRILRDSLLHSLSSNFNTKSSVIILKFLSQPTLIKHTPWKQVGTPTKVRVLKNTWVAKPIFFARALLAGPRFSPLFPFVGFWTLSHFVPFHLVILYLCPICPIFPILPLWSILALLILTYQPDLANLNLPTILIILPCQPAFANMIKEYHYPQICEAYCGLPFLGQPNFQKPSSSLCWGTNLFLFSRFFFFFGNT